MQINGKSCRASPSLVLTMAVSLAALPGCKSESSAPGGDTTPPAVASTTPADGATDVPVEQVLTALFSEPLRCASVGPSSVQVRAFAAIEGAVGCSGASVTFSPSAPLAPATTYSVTLTTDLADAAGNALAAAYRWSFTTLAVGDATPPTVSSTTPADGSEDVAVDLAHASATFSEPVDCDSVTTSSFELGGEAMVAGTIGCGGTTVTFTPAAALEYGTGYTATLTTAIRDLAGNHLASPHAWSFTTGPAPDTTPPTLVETHPADEATGIPTDVAIRATFSEPMDAVTLANTFTVARGGQPLSGTVTYSAAEHEAVFTPAEPLAPGVTYGATITTDATDVSGNHLEVTAIWYFTTATPRVRILYSWAGDLFSVGEDGTGTVTLAGHGVWTESFAGVSPDGRILYKLEDSELHSVSSDGTDDVTLVGGTARVNFLGLSSNGRVLYRLNGNLHAVNVDGSALATLSGTGDVEPLALSLAGGRVVFLRSDGGNRTLHSVLDDGTGGATLDGTPNPKGIYLAGPEGVVYYYRDLSGAYPNDDVYAVVADGSSAPVALAATTTYSEGLVALAPDGTPVITGCLSVSCEEEILYPGGADVHLGRGGVRGVTPGNRIVFERGELGALDIGTSSTSGAGLVDVAADPALNEQAVGIHPDGHILYRSRASDTYDLFGVFADGSGVITLAGTTAEESFVGISPEGWIVFEASGGGTVSLRAIRPDGSLPRTLAQSDRWLQFSGFSSSGKLLYLAEESSGAVNLWIVGFDDAPPVKLTDHAALAPEYFGSLP